MSNLTPMQRSLSCTQPIQFNNNNKNLSFTNESGLNRRKSLNKLGRKKTVSFSNSISIINVDSWKRYNIDVSESGGCLAWDYNKNKQKEEEEKKRRKQNEDGCVCIIY